MTDQERITQLEARIATLEARLATLERTPSAPCYPPLHPYPQHPWHPPIITQPISPSPNLPWSPWTTYCSTTDLAQN